MAILVKSAGNPYNEKESAGFQEVIEAAGATCIVKAPESATAEAQITMINELVAQKVSKKTRGYWRPDGLSPIEQRQAFLDALLLERQFPSGAGNLVV